MRKGRKIVFVLGLAGRVSVSIIVAKYNIFPRADNGRSPSASTVEIWSTLTYTEFDCVAPLAML